MQSAHRYRSSVQYLQQIYIVHFDSCITMSASGLFPRQKRYSARFLDLKALAPKVSSTFEAPAVITARPSRKNLNIHRNLVVNLLSPRWQAMEAIEELYLHLFVTFTSPFHGVSQGETVMVHDNRDYVVTMVSCGLFPVVGQDILERYGTSAALHREQEAYD